MSETDQSKPQSPPDAKAPGPKAPPKKPAKRPTEGRRRIKAWQIALVLLVLLAVVLAAALYDQNQQVQRLMTDLQQQHVADEQSMKDAQSQATQALSQARQQADQITTLRAALDETREQVRELNQALQMVSNSGSDLLLINDIDHLVTMAQQQLSLGGNVANAIASLEAAQAQLARANRPNLAALQQSINGDLDRLRAVATIDLPALSARVDTLSKLIGTAPLLVPDTAQPQAASPGSGADASVSLPPRPTLTEDWRSWAKDAWYWTRDSADALAEDLRGLFEVRRVDDAAALLISPDQAQRFREGLKQRAITAQLALLMHQTQIWRTELEQISQAVAKRYDMQAESSREALRLARELHDTPITVQLPTVDNSLDAIAAARDAAEAGEEGADASSDAQEADGDSGPGPADPEGSAESHQPAAAQ